MAIKWDQELFGCRDAAIDAQHRELFDQLNALVAACREGRGRDEVLRIFEFLGQYSQRHFAMEEELMRRRNCPSQEANKQAHEEFRHSYQELGEELARDGVTLAFVAKVQSNLCNWLTDHIQAIDSKLAGC